MNLPANVWFVLGGALLGSCLAAASALADPSALSAEGEEVIWWARLIWVVGIVVVFGLFLLAVCWIKFHWLPKRNQAKP
jgi:D-alanyl-lipoteichoic acid acyltransferase DltB (MBOAT superfamily)